MPELPDVVPGQIITADQDNEIRNRTGQRYVDATRRNAEAPTPGDGEQGLLIASFDYSVSNGTEWINYLQDDDYAKMQTRVGVLEGYAHAQDMSGAWENLLFGWGTRDLHEIQLPGDGDYEVYAGFTLDQDNATNIQSDNYVSARVFDPDAVSGVPVDWEPRAHAAQDGQVRRFSSLSVHGAIVSSLDLINNRLALGAHRTYISSSITTLVAFTYIIARRIPEQ